MVAGKQVPRLKTFLHHRPDPTWGIIAWTFLPGYPLQPFGGVMPLYGWVQSLWPTLSFLLRWCFSWCKELSARNWTEPTSSFHKGHPTSITQQSLQRTTNLAWVPNGSLEVKASVSLHQPLKELGSFSRVDILLQHFTYQGSIQVQTDLLVHDH